MRLFYSGAEVPSWRKLLAEENISDVSLSYMGLRRKVKFARPWTIESHFSATQSVLLDSGCYTVNKEDAAYDADELAEIAAAYMAFVSLNIDHVEFVTEFDALPLGQDWINGMREDYWDDLGDKFAPVWHSETGVDELERMASRYTRLAILETEVGDRDLTSLLNSLVTRHGVKLHGLAMTKPEIMREVRWESVGSTSWISPSQWGDTFVWTGKKLQRYPKKYKVECRKRHSTLIRNAGFDPALLLAEADPEATTPEAKHELNRFSLWSWEQFLADMNRRRAFSASPVTRETDSDDAIDGPEVFLDVTSGDVRVVNPETEVRNEHQETVTTAPREHQVMPGVNLVAKPPAEEDDDTPGGVAISPTSASLRMCDTCFMRNLDCPGYQPHAECAYELPVDLSVPTQMADAEDMVLTMQFKRISFMAMVEDAQGGYIEPELSKEIDRFYRMLKAKTDRQRTPGPLIQNVNMSGEMGMIGRIFGEQASKQLAAAEEPDPVAEMVANSEDKTPNDDGNG